MSTESLEDAIDDPVETARESIFNVGQTGHTHWIEEQKSWSETCYLGNFSFLPNLRVEGPDAKELFADLSVNNFDDYEVGSQSKHVIQCNADGKLISDGIHMRRGENEYTYGTQCMPRGYRDGVPFPANWITYNLETGDYDATAEMLEEDIYQVQGPKAVTVVEEVTDDDVRSIDFMHYREIEIAGHDVYALRHGMGGEPGFELHVPREHGDEIWNTIAEVGEEYGIRQIPKASLPLVLPLVIGLPQAGFDYIPAVFGDDMTGYREWLDTDTFGSVFAVEGSFEADDISDYYRSPIEYGWDYIDFDHDFVGQEALAEEMENPERTLVTLEWKDEDVFEVFRSFFDSGAHYKFMDMPQKPGFTVRSDEVRKDGDLVGATTNRAYYYEARQMISLCTIDVEHAEPGTEVTVVWGEGDRPTRSPTVEDHDLQKEVQARVAPSPYKEDRRTKGVEGERLATPGD